MTYFAAIYYVRELEPNLEVGHEHDIGARNVILKCQEVLHSLTMSRQ